MIKYIVPILLICSTAYAVSVDNSAGLKQSQPGYHSIVGSSGKVADVVNGGSLLVCSDCEGLAISAGLITGKINYSKFGFSPDLDTADGEVTIWGGAEDGTAWENMAYDYSTTANIDSISSSSGSDTEPIFIEGLDENYAFVTQSITLSGQTRVALTTPLIRAFRAYNNDGTLLVGHVFVYVNGAITSGVPDDNDSIRTVIDPNNQQTLMAVYTVPAGKTAYIRGFNASNAGANRSSNFIIRLKIRTFGSTFRTQYIVAISDDGSSLVDKKFIEPLKYEEKTDIELTVQMTAAGGTAAAISGGFDFVLVDN